MESIYSAAICIECGTHFEVGASGALPEKFIKKTLTKDGWFKCPICGEELEMQTADYDVTKHYFVVRNWMFRTASDGVIRPDVIWTDCGGSLNNAKAQHKANMENPEVTQSRIVTFITGDNQIISSDDVKTITNL